MIEKIFAPCLPGTYVDIVTLQEIVINAVANIVGGKECAAVKECARYVKDEIEVLLQARLGTDGCFNIELETDCSKNNLEIEIKHHGKNNFIQMELPEDIEWETEQKTKKDNGKAVFELKDIKLKSHDRKYRKVRICNNNGTKKVPLKYPSIGELKKVRLDRNGQVLALKVGNGKWIFRKDEFSKS